MDIFPFLEKYHYDKIYADEPIILIPEARGFLFYRDFDSNKALPLRKSNKLPGKLISISTEKEYGKDTLFFQEDALRRHIIRYREKNPHATVIPVMLFDDVAATGMTAESIINFFRNFTFEGCTFYFTRCRFFFELSNLGARERLNKLNVNFETYYSISL